MSSAHREGEDEHREGRDALQGAGRGEEGVQAPPLLLPKALQRHCSAGVGQED